MTQKVMFVDKNGRYCCSDKALRIGKGCACGYTLTLMNAGPLDLLVFPTGETDEASMVSQTLENGTTILTAAGAYKLDLAALKALEGTVAPEDPADQILIGCCEINCEAIGDVAVCAKLQEILDAIGGDVIVDIDLQSVIDKMCLLLDDDSTIATKLCAASDCLELIKANATAWCAADAIFQAANLACLAEIKANTSAIVGIETSLGQIGCTEDVEGNITGSVLVCKHTLPDDTQEIKVWWFGLDGTVVEDYVGPYVACTNLQALKNCLDNILKKTFANHTLWGVREDLNTVDNHSIGEPRPVGPGIVAWPTHEHVLKVTTSDGSTCEALWPATTAGDWEGSNTNLAAALAQCTGKPFAFAVAGPDGDTASAWGGHAASTCCPGDVYVVQATACRSLDGKIIEAGEKGNRTIPLAVNYAVGDVVKYKEYDCGPGEPPVWTGPDGAVLAEAPDLTCGFVDCLFPDSKPSCCPVPVDCSVKTFGPLVDCEFSDDTEVEPITLASDIYVDLETCDGVTVQSIYTLDVEGLPDEYVVQGELANPDKTLFMVEPPCPDIDWTPVAIQRKLNILDNSLWADAPETHIGVGDFPATQVEIAWTDNTISVFDWAGGKGFFPAMRDFLIAETGCVYYPAVANWAKLATSLPWGMTDADVSKDCLFARGWSLMCCTGSKCVAKATVIKSENEAWVGASKAACTFDGPIESMFVGHVGCDAVYKDCDGKMVVLPEGCCPIVGDPCTTCTPLVTNEAVCSNAEQVVNGVTIAPLYPVIRRTVQQRKLRGCACVNDGEPAVRFYNFDDPTQEFTEEVVVDGLCEAVTESTLERCDKEGNLVLVTILTVNNSGEALAVTYADANGNVIEPPNDLGVCDPQVSVLCGCIKTKTGEILVRDVQQHLLTGPDGSSLASYYAANGVTEITLEDGQLFSCDCEDRKIDTLPKAKATYEIAGVFPYPCTSATIEVDGELVDLCGNADSPTVIPSEGDICTVGGVRSDTSSDRCYVDSVSDPSGYANELLQYGSIGDKTANALAATATANVCMAVRGTYPALEGTTAPTIDFSATWHTGSGIAIAAKDCTTGADLAVVGGTPSTYDAVGGPGCQVPSSRGPTDVWGFNGAHTVTFDTSAVTDLANVVFYTIVLNPGTSDTNADYLSDVTVNGQSASGAPCDIISNATLLATLQALFPECDVAIIISRAFTRLCITCEDDRVFGELCCDGICVAPTITDLSREIRPQYVALSPCALDDMKACITQGVIDALSHCPAVEEATKKTVIGFSETSMAAEQPADCAVGDTVEVQDTNGKVLGEVVIAEVFVGEGITKYNLSSNTVAADDYASVATASVKKRTALQSLVIEATADTLVTDKAVTLEKTAQLMKTDGTVLGEATIEKAIATARTMTYAVSDVTVKKGELSEVAVVWEKATKVEEPKTETRR